MLRTALVTALIGLGVAAPMRERANAPQMRALIIAVSDYDPAHGYRPLNSKNDVPRIRAALELHGFDSTNIKVVMDGAATRAGILSALRELAAAAQPGDVVVIHYSGHGDRLTDNNGDELDGLDELLVPIDAPYDTLGIRTGTYKGERHIRDDDLQPILLQLRSRVWRATEPGNVTLFIDACFSGTINRGDEDLASRGTEVPLGAPASGTRSGGEDEGSGSEELVARGDESRLAPMVIMSAARQDQVARETRDQDTKLGVFTLALTRVLGRTPPGKISYRAIMHQVAAEIDAMDFPQRPQLEGNADAELFSGLSKAQTAYYKIRDVRSDSVIRIQGGSVLGVLPGAQIAFYPVGTRNPDSAGVPAIANGVVRRSTELYADVAVAAGADTATINRSWAFMTRPAFGDLRVRVQLDESITTAQRAALKASLDTVGLVQLVDKEADIVVFNRAAKVGFRAPADSAHVSIVAPVDVATPKFADSVRKHVSVYARGRFLKERVHMSDPAIDVRLELIPVIHEYDDDRACVKSDTIPAAKRLSKGNEWELKPTDGFLLKLKNAGKDNAYVTILYVMPNGKVVQIFPHTEESIESAYLKAGAEYPITLCYTPDDTPGTHMLKLFATREPVDFSSLTRAGGAEPPSPLELLVGAAMGNTRDPGTAPPARGTGTTTSLLLHIVP